MESLPVNLSLRLLFLFVICRQVYESLNCNNHEGGLSVVSTISTTPFTMRSYWRKFPNTKVPDLDFVDIGNERNRYRTKMSRRMIILSLLLSGRLELNPGPDSIPFPCGNCGQDVRDDDAGVACDFCNVWFHCKCIGMTNSHYEQLCRNSNISWICNCGFPNFSHGLFKTCIETSNSFSLLKSVDGDFTASSASSTSLGNRPFSPDLTSTPNKANPKRRKPIHKLRGMQINCNGLKSAKSKVDFQAAIAQHSPDIILGCESKLDDGIPTYSIFPDNYEVYRKDRNAFGGGVFVAVKMDFASVVRPEFDCSAEVCWASIDFANNGTLYIGSCYRPPGAKSEVIDELQNSINNIIHKHRKMPALLLAGDFNLPDIDWDNIITSNPRTHAVHSHFLNFVNGCSLFQMSKEPTRPASGNILDLILTTLPDIVNNTQTKPGISDHDLIMFDINMRPKVQRKAVRKIYQYDKANKEDIKKRCSEMTSQYFERSPDEASVEENWHFLKSNILSIMSYIPHRNSKSKVSHPYISKKIIREMDKRDKLYKKATRTKTPPDWETYKMKRNSVQRMKELAHNDYLNNVVGESLLTDAKKFWRYVKSQRRESAGIPTLKTGNMSYSTSEEKAQALNAQFSSVFTRSDDSSTLPDKGPSPYEPIENLCISPPGVNKQLKDLNVNKASGPDEIPARMLRDYADEITPALTHLFQQSYNQGVLPSDWLKGRVAAIYKSGDKSNPANYRPVSLTCLCCKILEHIILSHMSKFLARNDIINPMQHGFRKGLSCETQLIEAVDDWANNINRRHQTDVIFLDFSKAFDKVSHRKLLHKLKYYGITGLTHSWIQAFLSSRSQSVCVNGAASLPTDVLSGVPQGSVLGPVLFLLYINDISENVLSSIRLFADDCVLYRQTQTKDDFNKLQQDLTKLAEWAKVWDMSFNVKKCAHMCISLKRHPVRHNFHIHGQQVPDASSYKYLGVTVSSDLGWNTHAQKVQAKAARTLGVIRRALGKCDQQVKATAYKQLVRPQLEYASCAWNPHTQKDIYLLESIQRQAARFVLHDYRREASVTAMLSSLGWNTLQHRRLLSQCEMFFKIHHKLVNINMPSGIHLHPGDSRTLRSQHGGNQLRYIQPFGRVNCYMFSMFPRAIRIWNTLPNTAVTSTTVADFRETTLPVIQEMLPPPPLRML